MNIFIDNLKKTAEKIYDQIGGTEEKHIQAALSIEFDKLKVPHLREPSIQIYYDSYPLGFLELDFIISPHGDLQEYLIIEMKQASKIDDSNRHQLKSQLRSAPLNNHEIINKVTKGILLNFKKVEKYKEGINVIPEEKIDLEVWSYKDNKLIFEKI